MDQITDSNVTYRVIKNNAIICSSSCSIKLFQFCVAHIFYTTLYDTIEIDYNGSTHVINSWDYKYTENLEFSYEEHIRLLQSCITIPY